MTRIKTIVSKATASEGSKVTIEGSTVIAGGKVSFEIIMPNDEKFALCMRSFKAGLKLSDEKWVEKTRWIPIEERLPKVRENEYSVYAKNERKKNDYAILVIEDSISIHYLKKAFTHWKEIEL